MRSVLTICLFCLLATACSKVPGQSGYPYSSQHRIQSADHWQKLADDVVNDQIASYLKKSKTSSKVYVDDRDKSDFGLAFNTYLLTELFDNEIAVADRYDQNAVKLEWTVQQIRHESSRENPYKGIFVEAGALAAEFLVGANSYRSSSAIPKSEIIVSTRIINNSKTQSIKTETFYIDDQDTGNYWFIENYQQGLAFVERGAVVCKNKRNLHSALNDDGMGHSSLNALSALGDCAVMTKNHPVNIINNDGQSLVIRSIDDSETYVTSTSSVSPI